MLYGILIDVICSTMSILKQYLKTMNVYYYMPKEKAQKAQKEALGNIRENKGL